MDNLFPDLPLRGNNLLSTYTYVTDDGVNPPLECTAVYTKN